MNLQTTLEIIQAHRPCADGWAKLLRHLGPDWPEDKPIDFATILESNGLLDALWALRAVLPEQEKERDRLARLFACDCAEAAWAVARVVATASQTALFKKHFCQPQP